MSGADPDAPTLRRALCCAVLLCSVAACSSTGPCHTSDAPADALRTIYVVQRGWHTGVVIATADWPNQSWRVLKDFPYAEYLEFGWGDERFYQAETETLWLGSRAALWPTSSVVHVIGLTEPAAADARADEMVAVRVSVDGLKELASSIEREFAADRPSGPELHAAPKPNRFYEAKRSFYFPRMCNWWIAERLQEAGCPIQAWSVVTAERVIREARGFAPAVEQAR